MSGGYRRTKADNVSGDDEAVRYTVLSNRAIGAWAVLIVVVGVGVAVWLLSAYGHGDPQVQLDAIRTAGTIVVGTGGAAALLLAARRQRSTEIALRQTDREQVTDLYSKAVEQLGSERASVRLGGFYALERLAQDNPGQRQNVVNVLCAYLRMPYTNPGGPPSDDADDAVLAVYRERVQEREVRLTVQRLLTTHLRLDIEAARRVDAFWTDVDLDLTGATLLDFDLSYCRVRTATFTHATFTDHATFERAEFTGDTTSFDQAKFVGTALFAGADFFGDTRFADAEFTRGLVRECQLRRGHVRRRQVRRRHFICQHRVRWGSLVPRRRVHRSDGIRAGRVHRSRPVHQRRIH